MAYWHTQSLTDHGYLDALWTAQASAAKTLAQHAGFDGKWSSSAERLAKLAGVSKGTLLKAADRLEELGLISRERQGRRSATVYTWHSCPQGCSDARHTAKKDTRGSRYLFGEMQTAGRSSAVDVEKPVKLSKRKRRAQASQKVKFQPVSGSVSGSLSPESDALSSSLSGSLSELLKDEKPLNREVSNSETSQTDNTHDYALVVEAVGNYPQPPSMSSEVIRTPMWHYGALFLDVRGLADDDQWADSLGAQVVLDLLTDPQTSETVCALAVELWGTPPQGSELTFDHVEQLREHFEIRTGIDTREHYAAIYRYNTQGAGIRWRDLPQSLKDDWLRKYAYATAAMQVIPADWPEYRRRSDGRDDWSLQSTPQPAQVSPVAHSVAETHPREFGRIFAPPPVDELMERLSALTPKQTPPASLR